MRPTFVLALSTISGCCAAGCLPVTRDRIHARDLSAADASFAALPAEQIIGFPPLPGAKRVFTSSDLGAIARNNGLQFSNGESVCFEIPMRPIVKENLLASMRNALPSETDLTLIEVPAGDFPVGAFEFPLTALEPPPPRSGGVRAWRGWVRYGDTLRARVSVGVDVRRRVPAVTAAIPISRGARIDPSQLRLATVSIPFGQERGLASGFADVLGSITKSDIAAGAPIVMTTLERPWAVRRGDPVLVKVQSGQARIRMDAVAEISARAGDQLELRNPASGKVFHARLEDTGEAVIVVSARTGR